MLPFMKNLLLESSSLPNINWFLLIDSFKFIFDDLA